MTDSEALTAAKVTAADLTVVPSDKGVAFLHVLCPVTSMKFCTFKIWTQPARVEDLRWHWDGSVFQPTISPSIDCKGGCGRHFTVTKGEVL